MRASFKNLQIQNKEDDYTPVGLTLLLPGQKYRYTKSPPALPLNGGSKLISIHQITGLTFRGNRASCTGLRSRCPPVHSGFLAGREVQVSG